LPALQRSMPAFALFLSVGSLLLFAPLSLAQSGASNGAISPSLLYRVDALLGFLLLIPIGLTLWLRRRALHAPPEAREAVLFSYFRFIRFGSLLGIIVWWAAADLTNLFGIDAAWIASFGDMNPIIPTYLSWVVIWIPPAIIYLISHSLSAPIHRLRGTDYTPSQLFSQSFWALAMIFLPLISILVGFAVMFVSIRLGLLLIGAAILSVQFLRLQALRSRGMQLQALTSGELHDRAFALAHNAGVKLNQIYVLSTERIRMANAFAHQANNIILTDYLLKNMNRREVDAVIAHELSHLKQKHLVTRQVILYVLIGAYVWAALSFHFFENSRFPLTPLLYAGLLLILYLISRAHEYAADAGAARLTHDPAAKITALAKLSRLNMTPLQWSRVSEKVLTHPSAIRRITRVARAFNISDAAMPELLRQASVPPGDVYPLPPTLAPGSKIFSTIYKARRSFIAAWGINLVVVLIPSLVALIARWLQWEGLALWLVFAFGLALTIAVYFFLADFLPLREVDRIESQLRRKAEKAGAPAGLPSGSFVALSPDPEPRIYEKNWAWDLGFVTLAGDRLNYWGEESQFSLSREQITRIRLGDGPAGWFHTPAVYISWADPAGRELTFNLRLMRATTMRRMARQTRELASQLAGWHQGASLPSGTPLFSSSMPLSDVALAAPAFRSVTSASPEVVAKPRFVIRSLLFAAFLGGFVALIMGLHTGVFMLFSGRPELLPSADYSVWYVVAVSFIVRFVQLLPFLRARRAIPPPQPSPSPVPASPA
jgi:Zn-dependent protease with chaperone function